VVRAVVGFVRGARIWGTGAWIWTGIGRRLGLGCEPKEVTLITSHLFSEKYSNTYTVDGPRRQEWCDTFTIEKLIASNFPQGQCEADSIMDPIRVLREAIRAVPALKFALAVAGLAAVVAIVLGFHLKPALAVFGVLIVLGLMFLIVVFSRYAAGSSGSSGPATVLVWFYTVATISATILFSSSVFFSWPHSPFSKNKTPAEISRVKYFAGNWVSKKDESTTWKFGACAVSDVAIATEGNLALNNLDSDTGSYSGSYVFDYSGKVVHDGTPKGNCVWYQTGRPDYHYRIFRTLAISCADPSQCRMNLGDVTCEGDCAEAKNLPVGTTMIVPDASRTATSFDAINGDGSALSFQKIKVE
jgi:hypothetical protein